VQIFSRVHIIVCCCRCRHVDVVTACFATLSEKALDIWLLHLFTHRRRLSHHYEPTSLFSACSAASSSDRQLFVDLLIALRPLTRLPPFRLEVDCELRILSTDHPRRRAHVTASGVVDKHLLDCVPASSLPLSLVNGVRGLVTRWLDGSVTRRGPWDGTAAVGRLWQGAVATACSIADRVTDLVVLANEETSRSTTARLIGCSRMRTCKTVC
jgi:hypothetical protein